MPAKVRDSMSGYPRVRFLTDVHGGHYEHEDGARKHDLETNSDDYPGVLVLETNTQL